LKKDVALALRERTLEAARVFSDPFRDRNPGGETFEVEDIRVLSEFTAAVIFKKNTDKRAVAFFYYVKDQWRYFFPSDSHILGMEAFPEIKRGVEIENFSRN
jgi:hypothetical protein